MLSTSKSLGSTFAAIAAAFALVPLGCSAKGPDDDSLTSTHELNEWRSCIVDCDGRESCPANQRTSDNAYENCQKYVTDTYAYNGFWNGKACTLSYVYSGSCAQWQRGEPSGSEPSQGGSSGSNSNGSSSGSNSSGGSSSGGSSSGGSSGSNQGCNYTGESCNNSFDCCGGSYCRSDGTCSSGAGPRPDWGGNCKVEGADCRTHDDCCGNLLCYAPGRCTRPY